MTSRERAAAGVIVALALSSCSRTASPPAEPSRSPAGADRRIVSLAPSITEIAYSIGCGGELVGDTSFDDYPSAAKTLPHVADLAHVDLEALAKLKPSVVLALHDHEKEGGEIAERLHVPVAYLPNRGLKDLYSDIAGVGKACDRAAPARGAIVRIQGRVDAVAARTTHERPKPRVLFLLGLPGFTAGTGSYLDDLIRAAGGVNVAARVDQPYPNLSGESIVAMQPDVIVVAHEVPFGDDVRSREPWRSLNAVKAGRVEVSPDDDIIERPGPRIVDGLEWLEKAIHAH